MKLKFIFILLSVSLFAQENPAASFWKQLQQHCGNTYEGVITKDLGNDDFANKKLLMHVRSCNESEIKIPFFVGENKSRTWILRFKNNRIQLKHDHRKPDGSEEEITQYGGTSTNIGLSNVQVFPADMETATLLPAAATNVWWITLDEESFTYNLKRIGREGHFTVKFDLSNQVASPVAPWGWETN